MPIAEFDAASSASFASGASHNLGHTGTGSGLLAVASIVHKGGDPGAVTATYDGVSMTLDHSVVDGVDRFNVFILNGVSPGAKTVAFSWAIARAGVCSVQTVKNASAEAVPYGAKFTASVASDFSVSVDVTDSGTGHLVVDSLFMVNDTNPTVGPSQTERFDQGGNGRNAGSTEPGNGTVTMSWSFGSTNATIWARSIKRSKHRSKVFIIT